MKRIEKLEVQVEHLNEIKAKDFAQINILIAQQKQALKVMLVMLLHMRDDNHTGEMDKMIRELQATIIDS